ncbi:MAG: tripartite tricarboxylate transporter TctB family protein [Proteobacteria bacterium]|nr:tripartite tricarboxylate transporter TctB family protein [Pseudomonadota bacterium]
MGWRADATIALGVLFAFAVIVAVGADYPEEVRLFPMIIGAAGMVLAATVLVTLALRLGAGAPGEGGTDGEGAGGRRQTWIALATAPAYSLLLWLFGYWIASLACMVGLPWLLGYRNLKVLAVLAVAIVGGVGVFFPGTMAIYLPRGALVEWLRGALAPAG